MAHEKDRRTFVLLLLTNLSNQELVLGKLLASLLHVLVMFAAGLPVFMLLALLGGISVGPDRTPAAVTAASILVCGSLGSTLALWREKTFQALALFVLILVLWLALGEMLAAGFWGCARRRARPLWATAVSPWQAILAASRPLRQSISGLVARLADLPVSAPGDGHGRTAERLGRVRVRAWNAAGQDEPMQKPEDGSGQRAGIGERQTAVSDNVPLSTFTSRRPRVPAARSRPLPPRRLGQSDPLARIRTWAYGRKILIVRLTFLVFFALAAGNLWRIADGPRNEPRPGSVRRAAHAVVEPGAGERPGGHRPDRQRDTKPSICCWLPI